MYTKIEQYFTLDGGFLTLTTDAGDMKFEEVAFPSGDLEKNLKTINAMIGRGKDRALDYFNRTRAFSGPLLEGVFPGVTASSAVAELRRLGHKPPLKIKDVILNDPATIVFWNDGTKTVVKAENEPFDREKGLAMAIAKKHLGNKGNYFEVFKKYLKEGE